MGGGNFLGTVVAPWSPFVKTVRSGGSSEDIALAMLDPYDFQGGAVKSSLNKDGGTSTAVEPDTGKLTDEDAADIARKRMFRSGTIFTSPTGVLSDSSTTTTSARLK
jgi:hypothetical protein